MKKQRLFPVLISICFLSSCSQGMLLVMEANYYNSRGKYDEAIVSYLKALEYHESAPYAEYGLGSVFYSLGEGKAALERFGNCQKLLETQSPQEHRELRYRNAYNSGVVHFAEGDFTAAASDFRNSLRIDPRRIEAKRNLELTLMTLERQSAGSDRTENQQQEENRVVLFEYIRVKEQNQWKSREWTEDESFMGPDY
ncbi:MAG: tetratricopeptide repeat protein [Treponema sp.]|nr:tetratricopeptide repeat protein [Treponema sp.]